VRDFSISRSAVQWGIPMRQDPSHTVYVWFDALNGYLSGLLPLSDAPGSSNGDASSSSSSVDTALAQGWPADVHVIGKDILRFHAIYWPGMLMSAGLPLPKQVGKASLRLIPGFLFLPEHALLKIVEAHKAHIAAEHACQLHAFLPMVASI
jgi:methionyl-tRNA synthetase